MKKCFLSMLLILAMALAAFAPVAKADTIAEGSGRLIFQTVEMDPAHPYQWISDYIRGRVNIEIGYQFWCSPAGTIEIRGPLHPDGTWISMHFKTGGLVHKKAFRVSQILFNGTGYFCLYRPATEGDEPSLDNLVEGYVSRDDGTWEHGKAAIGGKAQYNPRNGVGRFIPGQTVFFGGNYGFLFRGILQGIVHISEAD